jgi:hypothetical protein
MFRSWPRAVLAAVLLAGPATACSLINAFDAVKQQVEGGTAEAGGDATLPADSGEAGATDSPLNESGNHPDTSGSFPDKGVVVISGRISDDAGNFTGVLTAIAPEDGTELPNARQPLNVPVVLYDGYRDLWWVIESDGQSLFPTATDRAVLHARTLDPVSGTWKTLSSLQIPPPVFGLAAVLTNRFVYVGFDNSAAALSGTSLITIDTTDPAALSLYSGTTPLAVQPFGVVGTRSQMGSNGGSLNLLESLPCDDAGSGGDAGLATDAGDAAGAISGAQRCLTVQHVTVPTNPDPATLELSTELGPFFGKPAFGSFIAGGPVDVIAWSLPGSNPAAPGLTSINTYLPANLAPAGTTIPFSTSDGFFQPLAFAECAGQALLIATNEDLSVYAVPLVSTAPQARAVTGHSGQSVYFEPYTSTVLVPFTQGDNHELQGFTLSMMGTSPKLTQRMTGWTPPADVRPEVLAVREPLPLRCGDAGP